MYIVSSISIFFDLQIYSILQSENRLRKTKDADKITIDRKEVKRAREIKVETKETEVKIRTTETSTETDAKTDAKTIVAAATITTDRKYLLKLRKQFVCIYISFVFKTVSILLSYLLLFNNL